MTPPRIPSLEEFLKTDLDYICGNLKEEFGRMAGQSLLITGGAGFLGYYLVLSALHFNKTAAQPAATAGREGANAADFDKFKNIANQPKRDTPKP